MNLLTRFIAPTLSAAAIAFAVVALPAAAQAQAIKVVVNSQPITTLEIQQRKALLRLVERKNVSDKDVIDQLVDEALVRQEGQRRKVSISDEEVNTRYAGVGASTKMTLPQLGQALAQGGTSERAFKSYIRGQLLNRRVLASKFDVSRAVGQSDITAQLAQQQQAGKAPATHRYTVRQVIFVLPKKASDSDVQRRRQEANSMRGRISSCDQAASVALGMRNVAVKEPVIRSTSQIGEQLDKQLAGLKIGSASSPDRTEDGVEMIVLCNREAIVDDSFQRQRIQSELADEKFKSQRGDILGDLRKRAVIEYR